LAKTVLIVDDNAYIRQALCRVFKCESDFEVRGEAVDGREAIAKAQELHPDLMVLDLSMPVMNGLDAARELKRLMPTVPRMMYSAFGDRLVEQQAPSGRGFRTGFQITACGYLVSKARSLLYRTAA
jgi:DNA-binding NarL/FixJ family response regulator